MLNLTHSLATEKLMLSQLQSKSDKQILTLAIEQIKDSQLI